MATSLFMLKTAPPRLGRDFIVRPGLERRWSEVSDRTAIIVTAPQGFGKTMLLAHWRRLWLEQGAYVAWASLDAQDDRAYFVNLLLFALRDATGREAFAAATTQNRLHKNQEIDALTTLLAQVAGLASRTVIVLDDAHRMPQDTLRELLSYLLNNAPPNLQFLIGTRRPLELDLSDLMAAGRLATLSAGDLRLSQEESLEFLNARFGSRIGLDDAVRLHELTEGWLLGLQLAAATVERAQDTHKLVRELSARRGDLQRFFFESLISRLTADEAAFLVRISILEQLNAELCATVAAIPGGQRIFDDLMRHSPVVTAGEQREWFRLHAMARDFLLGQFDKLPVEERRACYGRAAAWFAERGYLQEAARHAWAAGDEALAIDYVATCLRDIAAGGRLGEARDWLKRLPPSVVGRDLRLLQTAAWSSAMGGAIEQVPVMIAQIRAHPQCDAIGAFEASLIAGAAAAFRDQPGALAEALAPLGEPPPGAPDLYRLSLANQRGILALLTGDPERARRMLDERVGAELRESGLRLPLGFVDLVKGVAFLWEGNPARALEVLRPSLETAERELGRRSEVAAMLSGACAAAYWLQDEVELALATLADRLDVIEAAGMPDAVVLAYRVLAESAARAGDERRALEVLQSLRDYATTHELPRVLVASLAGQLRIHAAAARVATAAEILAELQSLRPTFERAEYRPFLPMLGRRLAVAEGSLRLAQGDPEGARRALGTLEGVPACLRFNPDVLSHGALRALAGFRCGEAGARERLEEVMSLAALRGMRRYIEETHPGIASLLEPRAPSTAQAGAPAAAGDSRRAGDAERPSPPVSGLLTPKEAHVLSLLSSGMANKEIARALDIGEQTVKWHLKNLFFKLNAASRRHAVDRARVLGLLGV